MPMMSSIGIPCWQKPITPAPITVLKQGEAGHGEFMAPPGVAGLASHEVQQQDIMSSPRAAAAPGLWQTLLSAAVDGYEWPHFPCIADCIMPGSTAV